jgi:hypothetical protein
MIAPLLLVVALQSAEVTEPNTQVKFPVQLSAPSGAQLLTGTGVRTRTVLQVKVYAFGLYVDSAGAHSALSAWRGKNAEELARDQSLYNEVTKGGFPATLRLVMTRDVGADQMSEAFNEALGPRVAQAGERGMTGGTEALTTFRGFFSNELSKGTELVFARSGDTLKVSIGGQNKGDIVNGALGWALFDVYLGEKPITTVGKKTVIARLPDILGR